MPIALIYKPAILRLIEIISFYGGIQMKNILLTLSVLCLSAYGFAQDIPGFESMCEGYVGCTQEETAFYVLRNYLIFNEQMPIEQIEPTLNQWYKENPTIFHYTEQLLKPGNTMDSDLKHDPDLLTAYSNVFQQAAKLMPNLSYTDMCVMFAKVAAHHGEQPLFISGIVERSQEIARCLKQLNIQQALSNHQLDLLAQLVIIDIYYEYQGCEQASKTGQQIINILEQLIETFKTICYK